MEAAGGKHRQHPTLAGRQAGTPGRIEQTGTTAARSPSLSLLLAGQQLFHLASVMNARHPQPAARPTQATAPTPQQQQPRVLLGQQLLHGVGDEHAAHVQLYRRLLGIVVVVQVWASRAEGRKGTRLRASLSLEGPHCHLPKPQPRVATSPPHSTHQDAHHRLELHITIQPTNKQAHAGMRLESTLFQHPPGGA